MKRKTIRISASEIPGTDAKRDKEKATEKCGLWYIKARKKAGRLGNIFNPGSFFIARRGLIEIPTIARERERERLYKNGTLRMACDQIERGANFFGSHKKLSPLTAGVESKFFHESLRIFCSL